MEIVRYVERADHDVRVGLRQGDVVKRLTGIGQVAELLRLSQQEIHSLVETASSNGTGRPVADVLLLPPIDGLTEVWASGVTYERSKTARMEETTEKSVYERVYEADRPELFFKAPAWRVVTDGEPIGIRADSGLDVPEPELGLVINSDGECVGLVVCNDVSSRVIEGENPLYLPQAKVYAGSCAISTGIRLLPTVDDPNDLAITLEVVRDGKAVWQGETSTARMHRTFEDLIGYLFKGDAFPDGAVLSTGTGIIPELSFSLADGDVVNIEIANVGRLSNRVVIGREPFDWVVKALTDPFVRSEVRGEMRGELR